MNALLCFTPVFRKLIRTNTWGQLELRTLLFYKFLSFCQLVPSVSYGNTKAALWAPISFSPEGRNGYDLFNILKGSSWLRCCFFETTGFLNANFFVLGLVILMNFS